MKPLKDASHLFEYERLAHYAERPGFRITELQISPTQQVPWHCHSNVQDTFYVIEGQLSIFLMEPTRGGGMVRTLPCQRRIFLRHRF